MIRIFAIFTALFVVFSNAHASECDRLFYEEEDRKAALPHCKSEEKYFHVGWIYGELYKNCYEMKKYYRKDDSSSSIGNLGMSLLGGTSGCEQSIEEGLGYLKKAIEKGGTGFADILGDHYSKSNKNLAKKYYIKATKINSFTSNWGKNRAEDALTALLRILSSKEEIDLFLKNSLGQRSQCELSDHLLKNDPEYLVKYLARESLTTTFKNNLCENQRAYFLGYTHEMGLGNKEDFREAYRLYLIAGAEGNTLAKEARDRIRKQLSTEQVGQATCLADYGLEPSFFYKWRCGW